MLIANVFDKFLTRGTVFPDLAVEDNSCTAYAPPLPALPPASPAYVSAPPGNRASRARATLRGAAGRAPSRCAHMRTDAHARTHTHGLTRTHTRAAGRAPRRCSCLCTRSRRTSTSG